jgi:hypothetical protein
MSGRSFGWVIAASTKPLLWGYHNHSSRLVVSQLLQIGRHTSRPTLSFGLPQSLLQLPSIPGHPDTQLVTRLKVVDPQHNRQQRANRSHHLRPRHQDGLCRGRTLCGIRCHGRNSRDNPMETRQRHSKSGLFRRTETDPMCFEDKSDRSGRGILRAKASTWPHQKVYS